MNPGSNRPLTTWPEFFPGTECPKDQRAALQEQSLRLRGQQVEQVESFRDRARHPPAPFLKKNSSVSTCKGNWSFNIKQDILTRVYKTLIELLSTFYPGGTFSLWNRKTNGFKSQTRPAEYWVHLKPPSLVTEDPSPPLHRSSQLLPSGGTFKIPEITDSVCNIHIEHFKIRTAPSRSQPLLLTASLYVFCGLSPCILTCFCRLRAQMLLLEPPQEHFCHRAGQTDQTHCSWSFVWFQMETEHFWMCCREMVECFSEITEDKDCRVVVVSGAGKIFTAGGCRAVRVQPSVSGCFDSLCSLGFQGSTWWTWRAMCSSQKVMTCPESPGTSEEPSPSIRKRSPS